MTSSREPEFVDQLSDEELLDVVGPAEERPQSRGRSLRLVTPEEASDARYEAAQGQVLDAVQTLELPESAFKRMPWPALDGEFVGGIAPGKLWYWVMASNNGKTLTVRSFVEEKIAAREKVFLMSTETTPHDFRLALACNELGIYPGDLLSGEYLKWDTAATIRRDVKRVMAEATLYERQQYDLLQFPVQSGPMSVASVWRGLAEAEEQGADWVIGDHVDYLDVPPGAQEISISNAVNNAFDQGRRKYPDLRIILTSQMNQKPYDKLGRLAMLTAPVEDWVKFGGVKKQNADGMIGGYRPVKSPAPDDDTMKSYKAGHLAIEDVALSDAIRYKLMKHKDYGKWVGRSVTLEVYKGHVREFADRDKGPLHGIRTTGRTL